MDVIKTDCVDVKWSIIILQRLHKNIAVTNFVTISEHEKVFI